MSERSYSRQSDEEQLDHQRCQVLTRLITHLDREEVPHAGPDEDYERGPGDQLEAASDRTRRLDPAESANDRHDGCESDLSADPDGCGQDVQEQSDRRGTYGEHEDRLRSSRGITGVWRERRDLRREPVVEG